MNALGLWLFYLVLLTALFIYDLRWMLLPDVLVLLLIITGCLDVALRLSITGNLTPLAYVQQVLLGAGAPGSGHENPLPRPGARKVHRLQQIDEGGGKMDSQWLEKYDGPSHTGFGHRVVLCQSSLEPFLLMAQGPENAVGKPLIIPCSKPRTLVVLSTEAP